MIPTNIYVDNNVDDMSLKMKDSYTELARAVNGVVESFTPTLYGSTTAGTVTYTTQTGWYYRQGILIDVFFNVQWSNWVGGSGDINLMLPYTVFNSTDDIFNGTVGTNNLNYANASDTYVTMRLDSNSKKAYFVSHQYGGAEGNLQVQASGGLCGSIRYIGQVNQ